MADTNSNSGGVGFTGLLTIVFIVLKVLGKISWSWWWVLCPLWISASFVILVLLFMLLIFIASAVNR